MLYLLVMSAETGSSSVATKRTRTKTTRARSTASKKLSTQRASATRKSTASKKVATTRAPRKKTTAKRTATKKTRSSDQQELMLETEALATDSTEAETITDEGNSSDADQPVRRAPTVNQVSTERDWRLPPIPHMVVTVLALGLTVSGVVVGMSDPGEISIQGVLAERTQQIEQRREQGEDVSDLVIPRQDSSTRTDRPVLRPAAARSTPAPPAVTDTPTTTATSSVDEASVTDDVVVSESEAEQVFSDDDATTEEVVPTSDDLE